MQRIAVVTDALSSGEFYPIWRRYYGTMFGHTNLFVINWANGERMVDDEIGGVIRLPRPYDDGIRPAVISDFVNSLLGAYDVIIRVDVDEIVAVDPAVSRSLHTYLQSTNNPYYTARGLDVTQMPEEPRVTGDSILVNRSFATPNSALNKTCITRIPMHWSPGFHWSNVFPQCGPVFILHLKHIDMQWKLKWFNKITQQLKENEKTPESLMTYYEPDLDKISSHHAKVSKRPRMTGPSAIYRHDHYNQFINSITYDVKRDIYSGQYGAELVNCELPAAWKTLI